MIRFHWTTCMGPVAWMIAGAAIAQPYFIDNFEDGDAHDGNPVAWQATNPEPGETRQVQEGSYVLTPAAGSAYISDSPGVTDLGDVSLRTQLTYLDVPDSYSVIGLSARGNGRWIGGSYYWSGYWAALTTNGMMQIGRTSAGNVEIRGQIPFLPVQMESDVHLQFDLFGTHLALTAWEEGEPKPDSPQLELDDTYFTQGEIGIWSRRPNNLAPVAFRHFTAAPSTLESDFDLDADVDGSDFLQWQRGGSPDPFSPEELVRWRDEFGGGGPAAAGRVAEVPEPAAMVLWAAGALILRTRHRRPER